MSYYDIFIPVSWFPTPIKNEVSLLDINFLSSITNAARSEEDYRIKGVGDE